MKLIFILIAFAFISCSHDANIASCDDVTFVKDNYTIMPGNWLSYSGTDTIFQHQTFCDLQLDSLLLILPYDSISGGSVYHYRYVFANHNF